MILKYYLTDILWQCIHRSPHHPSHGDCILSIGETVLRYTVNSWDIVVGSTSSLRLCPCLTMLKSITPGFITSIKWMMGRLVLLVCKITLHPVSRQRHLPYPGSALCWHPCPLPATLCWPSWWSHSPLWEFHPHSAVVIIRINNSSGTTKMQYLWEKWKSVSSHQLPDKSQGKCLVPIHDIWPWKLWKSNDRFFLITQTCNSHKDKVQFFSKLHGIVTVTKNFLQSLGSHLGLLLRSFYPLPHNYSRSYEVHQLKHCE